MGMIVVHFDQQTGAPHAICWSFVSALKQVFLSFSITNGKKKEKRKEIANLTQITYLTGKKLMEKVEKVVFVTEKDGKSSYNTHKMLSKLQLERKVWVASDKL